MPHPSRFDRLPAPARAAFLLDFDGTLVDIAPTPESVSVPPGLRDTLLALRRVCGDALAVVSGRPIDQIDHFLPDVPFAVAGEHGIAVRHRPGGSIERATLPSLPEHWIDGCERIASAFPGARAERKKAGLVLHFRAVPEAGDAIRAEAERLIGDGEGAGLFHIQAAKMAWEIKPDGVSKENAVLALMQTEPFSGRLPVFVGDDVTDEDGIRGAEALGGTGFRIPADFPDPDAFRAWLHTLSRTAPGAAAWHG